MYIYDERQRFNVHTQLLKFYVRLSRSPRRQDQSTVNLLKREVFKFAMLSIQYYNLQYSI